MRVKAKICGLSTPEAVRAALDGKAAFLGFVFFEKSPRDIAPEAARLLAEPARGKAQVTALLVDPDDIEVLARGVDIARHIGAAKAFDDWRAQEVYPGPNWANASDRHDFIRRATDSFHHPAGTCRLGDVVDDALRVKGIAGLRVVDASILPGLPAAMINAAVTAVAEKASDLVLAG